MRTIFAGIDVGAAELVVTLRRNGKTGKVKTFSNTPERHAALINYLNPHKHHVRVCIEATGTYHLDLAIALSNQQGIEVMVMNPKAVKNFANAFMQRNKTDAVDAALLAEIAELVDFKNEFVAWMPPSETVLELRACARRITELSGQKAKNQLHALNATKLTPDAVLSSVKEDIAHLEKHALSIVEQEQDVKEAYQLITAVKGIGTASAISMLGELLVLPQGVTARQWVAHAGLEPREHTSGGSVNTCAERSRSKKPRLTKADNRHSCAE